MPKAKADPMAVQLVKNLKKNEKRLLDVIDLLERLNKGEKMKDKDKGLRAMVSLLEQLKEAHKDNVHWAVTFGHEKSAKRARRDTP